MTQKLFRRVALMLAVVVIAVATFAAMHLMSTIPPTSSTHYAPAIAWDCPSAPTHC